MSEKYKFTLKLPHHAGP